MEEWKYIFDSHILDRGYDYYISGRIESIYRKDDTVYAVVEGNYDYNVEIELDEDDDVYDVSCDCPYGYGCKHAACVCYHLEEKYVKKIQTNSNDYKLFDKTLKDEDFEEYLENELSNYNIEELKSFIIDISLEDNNIYRKLINKKDKLNTADLRIYKLRLNTLLNEAININDNYDFIRNLNSFIEEDLEKVEDNQLKLELIESICIKLASIEYVQDEDYFNNTLYILEKKIDQLLEKENNLSHEIERIFKYIAINYPNTAFIDNFEILFDKYIITTDKELELHLMEQELDRCNRYNKFNTLKEIINQLDENDYSYNTIIEFIEKHKNIKGYWKILATYYANDNRFDDAVKLLESKCRDYRYDTDSITALELLKQIYLNVGDTKYINCIERLIFNYNHYSDENMNLLKNYYKDWPDKKSQIMEHYEKNNDNHLLDLLLFEEDYESFKKLIFNNTNIHQLHRYEHILKKIYPSELLDAYEKLVLNILKEAKLKNYLKACNIFKDMIKIPNGKDKTEKLIKYLIECYPRRGRMIVEFKKIQELM